MIEVIASYDSVEPSKPDGFVKGHILFIDHTTKKIGTYENMYIDKYAFVLDVVKQFNNYKWHIININYEMCTVDLKGEKLKG